MKEEKLFYMLALQNVEGVGDVTHKKLLNYFEDAQAVLEASISELMRVEGIGDRLVTNLKNEAIFYKAERELSDIKRHQVHVVYYQESSYPSRLKHCEDGPVLLFSKKTLDWTNQRVVSVVGTRNATRQGREFCEQLIGDLATYNPIVVSGFALGIDITAHRAAIENQLKTVAVLGHGLSDVYPKEHQGYVGLLEKCGGFLTEFKIDSKIDKENFIRRNRVVAGLAEAVVVVESALKGGSMSTARFANDYHREVFAVPGRSGDLYSQGCNELIKWNNAQLISSARDIAAMLQWDRMDNSKGVIQKKLFVDLTVEEQKIYDYLVQSGKQPMDLISKTCQIAIYKIGAVLLGMELKGVVRPLPGKLFEAM